MTDTAEALHAPSAERSLNGALSTRERKQEYRKKRYQKQKRDHIINVLWKLDHRGIKEASARQIAGESDYCYSGNFSNFLNSLCDEGYLCMEVYPHDGGACSHKYTYMLPVNAGRDKRK